MTWDTEHISLDLRGTTTINIHDFDNEKICDAFGVELHRSRVRFRWKRTQRAAGKGGLHEAKNSGCFLAASLMTENGAFRLT